MATQPRTTRQPRDTPVSTPARPTARRGRRVLLLDEGWAATVYVAAGLSAAGCDVHAFTEEGSDARFLSGCLTRITAPAVSSPDYLPTLARLVGEGGFDHVLGLTDATLHALWRSPRDWEALDFPQTSRWQRELLRDKRLHAALATEAGVRVPEIRLVATAAAARDAVRALGLPVVVKGIAGVGGATVHIAHGEDEAVERWRSLQDDAPAFLQRHVAGPTYLVGGLFDRGEPLRLYAAEKIEVHPVPTGGSLRLETVADPELVAAAVAVFRRLGWTGLASADFMRGADGHCYFLEINPRPWGSVAAARAAGVDLFAPLAELLAGRVPTASLGFRAGVRSTHFPQRMVVSAADGTWGGLLRVLLDGGAWRAAPWGQPALLAHLARWPWWKWSQARRARAAARRSDARR